MFQKRKSFLRFLIVLPVLLISMVLQVWAAPMIRTGNILTSSGGGQVYYQNTNGAAAYVPFNFARQGDNMQVMAGMMSLPGANPGQGDWASNASFRYNGFNAYAGTQSQYLVKIAQCRSQANSNDYQWEAPSFYSYYGNDMFTFRYAGLIINSATKDGNNSDNDEKPLAVDAVAGTNPYFPPDTIKPSPSAGNDVQAAIYKKRVDPSTGEFSYTSEYVPAYGPGRGARNLSTLATNGMYGTSHYPGSGNVKSNKFTTINNKESLAKEAFEWWAEGSDGYGAAYMQKAKDWLAQNPESTLTEPWQVLNQFFQINGDPTGRQSTVYFYTVGDVNTHASYTTYCTEATIQKNVSPTFLAIKEDQSGKILGEAYRDHTHMDAQTGAGTESSTGRVVLQYDTYYTLEGILSFYAKDQVSSAASRAVDLMVSAGGDSDGIHVPVTLQPSSSLPDKGGLIHDGPVDGKAHGPIKASGHKTNYPGDTSYHYNGAAFYNHSFMLTSEMPKTGVLYIAVPEAFNEKGDNDVTSDDRLGIPYSIAEAPPSDIPHSKAFGDLNLGMPEYRDLHYLEEEEQEASGDDPNAEPPPPITYEYASGYGYYTDPDSTPVDNIGENDVPAEINNNTIWSAGHVSGSIGDAWWDYSDHEWPNQAEDLENKCWLTDANGAWNQSGEFMRSHAGEESFGFGFRVSRSRGERGTTLGSAVLETQIYGVSPDTGEEGVLLREYTNPNSDFKTLATGSIGDYEYADTKMLGIVSSAAINGIEDFPRIRVVSKISQTVHGESGLHNNYFAEPAENSWEEDHDTVDRTFACEMDDMRIMEIEMKDSEGIVIYHADRYDSDSMEVEVDGYFDKEEDLFLKVVVEQNIEKGHSVKDPAIDVLIVGTNEDGAPESTYIDKTYTLEGTTLGLGEIAVYDNIAFRPRSAHKLQLNVEINEKHGEDQWRENIWDNDDDAYVCVIDGTSADLSLVQDIELYNSKNNKQEYLTFAEYLSFKYDIKHIGTGERQMAVVGGSDFNPYPKVNVKIYNADALSTDPVHGNLIYKMATLDPKATQALLQEGDIQAKSRLFPGLGTNGYSTHVQAWFKDYVVQSFVTNSGNVAAYGHLLVTGNIDKFHDTNNTNIRNNATDYVQKELFGEKNFKIIDIGVTSRNSISEDTGIAVQMAIENTPSSYNDQTVVDKTYVDIYVDDTLEKTIEVEIPVGDTIVTEAIIEKLKLDSCKVVEVRVNTGKHQTHYEYMLKESDTSLYPDPFVDNYMSIIVCPNKPDETVCPLCIIDENVKVDDIFDNEDDPVLPDHDVVVDDSVYKVQFEANDGSGDNKTQSIKFNSSVTLTPNTFNRPGHTFKKWNTAPDGSGTDYSDKAIMSIGSKQSYGENTTLTLYAQWEAVTYTISFDPNGGSGKMEKINCTYDVAQYLPANEFTYEGGVFMSWNTKRDGSGTSVENGGSVMNFTDINGSNVTLYAQWLSDAPCVILENFVASSTVDLKPGDMIAENPSLMSLVNYSSYAYLMVKIPTVSAAKAGDPVERVYDLFSLDWNKANWVNVYQNISKTAGQPSIYVWRYNEILAPKGTKLSNSLNPARKANQTTDLYSRLTVGNFTSLGTVHVSTELLGLVYATPDGAVSPEDMAMTDRVACGLLGVPME